MSNLKKVSVLEDLVRAGRYGALHELLHGISEFSFEEDAEPMQDDEEQAWRMACLHVDFLCKYGPNRDWVQDGKRRIFAYPVEYRAWLEMGAPGVSLGDLERYLAANPV